MAEDSREGALGQERDGKRAPRAKRHYAANIAAPRLMLATLLGSTALVGFPDATLAACVNTGGTNWQCSDANVSGQDIVQDDANVTTQPGFSVDTADANAVSIVGLGAQVYDDGNASDLSAAGAALFIESNGGVAGSVAVTTGGNLAGGTNGIYARNFGLGTTTITTTGTVIGANGVGIYTDHGPVVIPGGFVGAELSINTAVVSGSTIGILADSVGGPISVTATGQVTGTTQYGIVVGRLQFSGDGTATGNFAAADAGDVSITASGGVSGGLTGILAPLLNVGALQVNTIGGLVSGATRDGIVALNNPTQTRPSSFLSIETDAVSGGRHGIVAMNGGSGSNTVNTHGAVSGGTGYGIAAANGVHSNSLAIINSGTIAVTGPAGTTLSVTANDAVSGGTDGIHTWNNGTGASTITTTGLVTGTSGTGILAQNAPTATDLTIEAADVTGRQNGIYAWNEGTGATDISAAGTVEGTGLIGILAINNVNTTGLTIEAAVVTGGADGIGAHNYGTGTTSVTATGLVEGTNRMGIAAWNAATAGDLSVTAADASGAIYGIGVANGSTAVVRGDTTVSASGTVSGGQVGIRAVNGGVDVVEFLAGNSAAAVDPGGHTLIIQAANVSGGEIGIDALNNGTGETWIGTSGAVEGTANYGIRAVNAATATNLTIEAVAVTGGWNGISADNGGTGETSVSATGIVQGTDGNGIVVHNQSTATDLTIEAATVIGAGSGISALNLGTGTTSITATGAVTGTSQHGIRALNEAATTENLLVYAASVSGGIDGISAENFGQGATAVVASGTVTGGDDGIYAMNAATATDLTIDAIDVEGGTYGVNASNSGAGSTRVTTTGLVQGGEAGIRAINEAGTLGLRVEAADVQSDLIGIEIRNNGIRGTTVIATGTVQGGFAGISAYNAVTATDLTIQAADVSGAAYGIFAQNDGIGATTITTNGTVTGMAAIVASGNAIDLINNGTIRGFVSLDSAASTFTNNGTWNGAGGESLFTGAASTLINIGSVIGGASADIAEATTWSGLRQFTTRGMVTLADGGAGDIVRQTGGNTRFEAGSMLAVDIDGAGHSDRFMTSGSATLVGATLAVSPTGIMPTYGARYTVLTADAGLIGQFASVTGLPADTAFLTIEDTYDANNAYLDVIKYRTFASAGLTPNQIATAGGLDSMMTGPVVNAVAALATDAQAQHAFDQLSGEVHTSARTAMIEDSRFLRSTVNDRLRAAFDGVGAVSMPVMAYADGGPQYVPATTDRFAVWGQAFGSWGHWNSDGNAARLNRSIGGFFVGADAPVFNTWRFGAVAGFSRTTFDARDRASSGSSDNYHLGLYGGTQWGDLAFRTGAAYTWHDITTNRSAIFPGFGDSLKGKYDAGTAQVFGELAYGLNAGSARFEPFANLAYVNLHTEGFIEQGGAAALTSPSANTDATFTTLGLRASTTFNLGEATVTAKGMLGWRHAFGDATPNAAMRFAGGDAFSIAGIPIARDAAVIEAGLDFALSSNAALGVSYGGQLGSGATDQTFRANFNMKF